MSWNEQPRRKGRFETKRKIAWKNNVVAGAKKRKLASDINKVEGQRIVNITQVAEDLWCKSCNKALSFRHVESETICGLASTFKVRCPNCTKIKTVATCNRAKYVSDNRKMMFENNYKGAIGVIDAGIGVTQLNTFLSTMNIPSVHSTLLKRYERLVGVAIEATAKESCAEAIKIEKEVSIAADTSRQPRSNDPVMIAASYDAAWPKRGNGHSYDSLAGISDVSVAND